MKKGSKTLLAAVLSFSIILSCAPFGVSGAANAPPANEQDSFLSQVWPGFENPSQDHMTTPLWFWNEAIETMSADRVREIVRESYEQSGYNGFGILPAFLSTADNYVFENEKFFEMYEAALDEASKYGMKVALYDEDGWPSGAAGGLVKRDHPEYTTRRLDKAEAEGAGGSAVILPTFSGDYLGAVMMNTETKEIVDISSDVKAAFDGFEASAAPSATASSIYSGAYKADYAVDGKEETRWNAASGQAMPQWVELNFTKPVSFDKVEIIQPYKENPVLNRITSYGIEYYDEAAKQWVEIKSGGTIGNSVTDTFDSVTASRMRIVVKKVSASSPSIAEIKVYDGDNELTPFGTKPDGPSYTIPQREGNWKVMVFSCAIQGNKGVDYLNPDAVKAYIGYTYDEFYERFGEYFGTTITKSFYDEPTLKQFREAGTEGNRTWTPNFNAMFEERYPGENPMLYYPALFYDIGANTQEARDKLYTARSDMFATSFIKQMNDWCADRGIQYMGHLYSEETVNPVSISGDLMRTFKYQSIPGVDHIGNANNTHQISRVITSAAYNWDKPLVMSETYGAAGANMPVGDLYRWAMDEFAAGVNYIVPHAVWYNDKVNVFYPPELSYRNEKYAAELQPYNTYVARLNQMLQGGRHVADIGVVYPIDYLESSFVMNSGDCNPADADYETVLTTLTQSIRKDITFLHPEVIDE
ncbi:MAG: glycosyl hydrolase, partial [Massilioclostridium sp.]|nr:glycosyl hydrolase [Massilioclostridium sp.]